MEDLSKGFKLKSVYNTGGKNNTEKAYDDLVLNNKTIDDMLYKKATNELTDRNNFFFRSKKVVWFQGWNWQKKSFIEEENSKFEKHVGETVKLKNQRVNLSATSEQKELNNFLEQIKEEQKNIDTVWFKKEFN